MTPAASVDVEKLLGPSLFENQPDADPKQVATSYALKDKTVGVFVCKDRGSEVNQLLSSLKSVYAILLSEGSRFEVVYVGEQREDKGKGEGMPWLSLPQEKVDSVVKELGVQEFPALVMIAPDGDILTKDGKKGLCNDPKGENYPWTDVPMTLWNTPLFPFLMVVLAWTVIWLLPSSLN